MLGFGLGLRPQNSGLAYGSLGLGLDVINSNI